MLLNILHKIDTLQKKCKSRTKKYSCAKDFLEIIDDITELFARPVDIICNFIADEREQFCIASNFQSPFNMQEKLLLDANKLNHSLILKKTPSIINSKSADISLNIKTGYFLVTPIFDSKMDIIGSVIIYSKIKKELSDNFQNISIVALAINSIFNSQNMEKIISKSTASTKNKKANPTDSTSIYRKDLDRVDNMLKNLPSTHIVGISLGEGIAIGNASVYGTPPPIENYCCDISEIDYEKERLTHAFIDVEQNIKNSLEKHRHHLSHTAIECLEMHILLLKDKMLKQQMLEAIELGLSADAAVEYTKQQNFINFAQIDDAYIKDRFDDIVDITNKLRIHLNNTDYQKRKNNGDIIIVASSLGISGLMEYDISKVKGIILESGNISSHIAIVANSSNIPILGQCTDALKYIKANDKIIIDCDQSVAFISPKAPTIRLYNRKIKQIKQIENLNRIEIKDELKTKDNIKISLQMNAGILSELPLMHKFGADGIGLFRTELTFMGWTKYPTVKKQIEVYRKVLETANDKEVIFRTLDIGGDKPLPYFDAPEEDNPALGWRAIRIGIDRPAVLRTQLTAMLKAASQTQKPLHVMIPLISEMSEIMHVRKMLQMTAQRLLKTGEALPPDIKMGVMLEVPSLIWQLDEVCNNVDFISVGTNDLMQYMFAADRGSMQMQSRYDILSPTMIRVMKQIADICKKHKTAFSICGEATSDPLNAMVFIALGYTRLSMPASKMLAVRNMCHTLNTKILKPYINKIIKLNEHSVRTELQAFAKDHYIVIS